MENNIKSEMETHDLILPKEQLEAVLNQERCDIDGEFMGFLNEYKYLSKIIPKHFTVIDLGCAYNPQCFYFIEHKKYIAVDIEKCIKFQSDNCEIFEKTINNFINENLHNYDLEETFAICSYVPDWYDKNKELVRQSFKNLFVFYPSNKEEYLKFNLNK